METKTLLEILTEKNKNSETYVSLFPVTDPLPGQWLEGYSTENMRKFADQRLMLLYGESRFPAVMGSVVGFWDNIWRCFVTLNSDQFSKAYTAMLADYNPTENYDKTSEITTAHYGKESYSETLGGAHIIQGATEDTSKVEESPENNNTFYSASKQTVNNGQRVTDYNPVTNTHETSFEGDTEHDTREDVVSERTHGNIGVTKNSELVQDELFRLRSDFLLSVFTRFILENTF